MTTRMTSGFFLEDPKTTSSCGVVGLSPTFLGMTKGISSDFFVGGRTRRNAARSLFFSFRSTSARFSSRLSAAPSLLSSLSTLVRLNSRGFLGGGGTATLVFPASESPVLLIPPARRTVPQNARPGDGAFCGFVILLLLIFAAALARRRCSRKALRGESSGAAACQRSCTLPLLHSVRTRWVAARHL